MFPPDCSRQVSVAGASEPWTSPSSTRYTGGPGRERAMTPEFQVQIADRAGKSWLAQALLAAICIAATVSYWL